MNDYFIRELKSRVVLSDLLSRYVSVQTKGGKKMACCPFHQEKTPSFHIEDNKGFYHCFGCGINGDAISFLQEHLSMAFVDAVKELCLLTGTQMPEFQPPNKEMETKLDIMQATLEFMKKELENSSNAKHYLQKRSITAEIQNHFEICYGGAVKDGLYKFLKQTFTNSEIKESGVCIESSYGSGMFDRFSGRIIFPIHSHSGKVIAFSGRIFNNEDGVAKYVNSPETDIFKKGEVLYNFHNARKTKERFVVVCEGFMDVIAFFKDGLPNAVAQMGTAFSTHYLTALSARFDEISFCLDSDNAGIASQKRIIETLFTQVDGTKTFSFIAIPSEKDPDDHLQKYGGGSLKNLAEKRIPLHQHAWNLWQKGLDFKNPADAIKLEKEIDAILAKNKDASIQKHYRHFFKNKIFEAKFQKTSQHSLNSRTSIEPKRTFMPFEENAIMFAYQFCNTIKEELDDVVSEMEIHFPHAAAKEIFHKALNGEDISTETETLQSHDIPQLQGAEEIRKYYTLLHYTSMLFNIGEEIKASIQNFEKMVFLSKQKDAITQKMREISGE